MKEFIFFQGDYPKGFTLNFSESLFNKSAHRQLQSRGNWISFYILDDAKKEIDGAFHVHVNGSEATSPHKAPFGSIEFSENVPQTVLTEFIKFVEDSLLKVGIALLTIRMPLAAYSPKTISLLQTLLVSKGFQIELTEVGSFIQVDDRDFKNFIKDSERHVLNQFKKRDFTCTQIPIDMLEEVYSFISKHQTSKGYTLSMSFDQMKETVDVFRNDFFLFVARDQDQMIGASISIRVQDHVLYNFYVTHDAAYKQYSPVIAIIEALYNFCKANSFSTLDLGTSMLQGKPNFSLLDFKRRLGGVDTEKLTLSKRLI